MRSWLKSLGILPFLGVLLLINSCSQPERHRLLNFFFDGVPPLEGEAVTTLPADDPRAAWQRPDVVWTVHPPHKNCETCHGDRAQQSFTRQVQLPVPPPDLCYRCHAGPAIPMCCPWAAFRMSAIAAILKDC